MTPTQHSFVPLPRVLLLHQPRDSSSELCCGRALILVTSTLSSRLVRISNALIAATTSQSARCPLLRLVASSLFTSHPSLGGCGRAASDVYALPLLDVQSGVLPGSVEATRGQFASGFRSSVPSLQPLISILSSFLAAQTRMTLFYVCTECKRNFTDPSLKRGRA